MSSMGNASRAKSAGAKRSGPAGPKPAGAVLGVGAPNPMLETSGSGAPSPVGAALAIGDGLGHLGDWADKEHPTA